jgi:hypothetical protein
MIRFLKSNTKTKDFFYFFNIKKKMIEKFIKFSLEKFIKNILK